MKIDVPVFPEYVFPPLLDFCDTLHSFDRSLHQVTVVSDRDVSALLEIDGRVLSSRGYLFRDRMKKVRAVGWTHDSHFLSSCLTEGFCPSDLPWISFHPINYEGKISWVDDTRENLLEVFVAPER